MSYTSEWVDTERTDSNGRKYKTKTLMHTAQVQFKDNQNRTLTLDNSVRSGDVPAVGEHITVVYESGDHTAQEKKLANNSIVCSRFIYAVYFRLCVAHDYCL